MGPVPHQLNHRTSYAKPRKETTVGEWKVQVWCGIGSIVCNWIAVVLYSVIVTMAAELRNKETFKDLTIYTQAIQDW